MTGNLLPATRGAGPLLQRDYWAVVRNCRCRPTEVVDLVLCRFKEFAPEDLTEFCRADGTDQPLSAGDVLEVDVFQVDNLDRTVQIDASGRISLPLIG